MENSRIYELRKFSELVRENWQKTVQSFNQFLQNSGGNFFSSNQTASNQINVQDSEVLNLNLELRIKLLQACRGVGAWRDLFLNIEDVHDFLQKKKPTSEQLLVYYESLGWKIQKFTLVSSVFLDLLDSFRV